MNENSDHQPDIPEAQELAKLQAQMLRPAQAVNRDGGFELGWGMAVLCFGLAPYFSVIVTQSRWFSPWTAWLGFLPLLAGAFAPYAVPKLIKRFITWPRTGYVATPNEMTLKQLVMLMIFGGALGSGIGLLFTLGVEALEEQGHLHHPAWRGLGLLVCIVLTVYLGRKVIRKRPPLPTAYDAAVLMQGLKQTATGRKRLRGVRFTLVSLLVGFPLVVFGIVIGLLYWNRSLLQPAEIHWPQLGLPGFLVAANALLYFMGSGLVLRPHRWKWFVLPVMLLAPILVAPAIPCPVVHAESSRLFDSVPPVLLCIGTVWFVSGALTLALFMRHNPLPAEAP